MHVNVVKSLMMMLLHIRPQLHKKCNFWPTLRNLPKILFVPWRVASADVIKISRIPLKPARGPTWWLQRNAGYVKSTFHASDPMAWTYLELNKRKWLIKYEYKCATSPQTFFVVCTFLLFLGHCVNYCCDVQCSLRENALHASLLPYCRMLWPDCS